MDGAGMSWGVKASFRDYVFASPDGSVQATAGAEVDAAHMLSWPLAEARAAALDFNGSVRFTAHLGMLDIELRDPVVTVSTGETTLTFTTGAGTTTLATLSLLSVPAPEDRVLYLGSDVRLTEAGSVLFGGQYPPGLELDPVLIALQARWAAADGATGS